MTAAVEAPSAPPEWPDGALYHSPVGLYDFQAEGVAVARLRTDLEDGRGGAMAVWDTGLGKAMPLSEPVLTDGGWVTMGALRVGHRVVGRDGCPTEVIAIHPQTDREVYRVTFSDGSSVRCNLDHLWTVTWWGSSRASGKQVRVKRTETLSLRRLVERGIKSPAGRRRFSIPMCSPVQYPEADLPVEPYALGVVLGDGWIGPRGQVHLGLNDKEVFDSFSGEPTLVREGYWRLVTTQWATGLRALGLAGTHSWDKRVPEEYLRASEDQRRALLAGLLDTDGCPIEDGGVEFSTTSHDLARAVQELAQSLGGTAIISAPRQTAYTHGGVVRAGRPSWRVNVKLDQQPFRLTRKMLRWVQPTKYPPARWIESVERVEDEEQVCITVAAPDGLYLTRHHVVTHNSHLAMVLAALLVEDDLADICVVVAEKNKIGEWAEDFAEFTRLAPLRHHGQGRMQRLAKAGVPDVLVTTYETGKADLVRAVKEPGKRGTTLRPGPLLEILESRRVLFVFDEVTKIKNRGADVHKAYDYAINRVLRRRPGSACRAVGLTATPLETGLEDYYNILRVVRPAGLPLVKDFNGRYVKARDLFDRPVYHRDLIPEFYEHYIRPVQHRKRKTDDDVRDQFPALTEESLHVEMPPDLLRLYETVRDLQDDADEDAEEPSEPIPGLWTTLRQIAGHPQALLRSQGKLSQMIVAEVGADYLRSLPAPKMGHLVADADLICNKQGEKLLVFTFFGQSVLPTLADALRKTGKDGIRVFLNHGQMSPDEQTEHRLGFRRYDGPCVMVSSDAGSRGLNMPEASYVINYELPTTYARYVQRINRASRLVGGGPTLTVRSYIMMGTVEEALAQTMMTRNEDHDMAVGDHEYDDENFISAADRRAMLNIWKRGKK